MPTPLTSVPWVWAWGPPGSLASEARFWDNPPFDIIRVLVVIVSAVLVLLIGRVLVEQARRVELMEPGQTLRFIGLALGVASVAITEAYVVGTTATPRLLINIGFIGISLAGVLKKRRRQKLEPLA